MIEQFGLHIKRVLIIDDYSPETTVLKEWLREFNCDISQIETKTETFKELDGQIFDLIIYGGIRVDHRNAMLEFLCRKNQTPFNKDTYLILMQTSINNKIDHFLEIHNPRNLIQLYGPFHRTEFRHAVKMALGKIPPVDNLAKAPQFMINFSHIFYENINFPLALSQ
jgi:hypothetical protein